MRYRKLPRAQFLSKGTKFGFPIGSPGETVCLREETGLVSGLVVLTCVLGAEQEGGKKECFSLFSLDEFLTFFKDETKNEYSQ